MDTPPPDRPYRLPSPLQHQDAGLPVAPSAPRIPRALRAFNGMPPPPAEPAPVKPALPARPREAQRSIRDLLLDADPPAEPEDTGLIAGLRSAWRRLHRPDASELDGSVD